MKKILFVLFALSTILALGSCQKKEDNKITIAGIVYQNDLFMKMVQIGIEKAGEDLGAEILLGNSGGQIDKESALIDTYIARKVDAIVITPLSAEGSAASLRRAVDAGIEIVLFNTSLEDETLYSSFIATEGYDLGKSSGQAAFKFIEDNLSDEPVIEIAAIAFKSQFAEISDARVAGFMDQVKNLGNVELVAEQDAWLAEQAIRVVGDVLTANPNIKIIYTANEGGTVGAVQAVRNAGKAGEIFVFGTDGSDQIAQILLAEDKVLQFSAAQQPIMLGYDSVKTAMNVLNGIEVEKNVSLSVLGLDINDSDGIKVFQEELKSYQ